MKKYPSITIRLDQETINRIDRAVSELCYPSRSAYIADAIIFQLQEDEQSDFGRYIRATHQ